MRTTTRTSGSPAASGAGDGGTLSRAWAYCGHCAPLGVGSAVLTAQQRERSRQQLAAACLRRRSIRNPTRPRRLDLFAASIGQVLPLAAFSGSPDGLDEAGVVNGVFKTGRGVGPRMHVADEMSIELSHIDGRPHEPA